GYQDDGTGKLVLSPAGLTGTNFGLISFYTKPVFNGSLNLSLTTRNGFQFASGQSFRLMSFPAATNWVSCLNGLDLENGILFQPQFTATTLSLVATAYNVSATKPQLFLGNTFGGVSVIWPDKFSAWTLQSATNLTSTLWTTVSACSDNALVPNAGQKQFFRLKQ
ncbi:MAG TPA: hypothetical protein VG347_06210, partial [Verrucomicrobiae bacterium]|nr:hypothetical protein [Verrucomicrobiae bacterium]